MKKENKKLAQLKRSEERKKQEQHRKLKKIAAIALPSLALIILIGVMILNPFSSSNTNSDSSDDASTTAEATTDTDNTADTSDDLTEEEPAYLTDTTMTIEDGDTVNIDYVGYIDGVEFDGGSTNEAGTDLVIGSGSYIDDFEDQLIGAHPGDWLEVNVTFPEDYGNEDLNGKDAMFKVFINGIYE